MEKEGPFYMLFLDWEKAFDKVFFEAILDSLRSCGVEEGYIEAIADLYANLSLYVEVDGMKRSRDVKKVERGVRQGDGELRR